MKDSKVNNPEDRQVEDENKVLLEKVKKALSELGADVQAQANIFVDDKGYIRIVAVPRVIDATGIQKEQDEGPKKSNTAEGKTEGERVPEATE